MLDLMEPTVSAIFRKYLDWCEKHRSARTTEWYGGHLGSFLAHLGDQANHSLSSLKPYHVVEWVDSHETWGDTYKRGGIVAVQRACNWAEQMGYIDSTPLKRIAKPPARRRDNPMTPEDFQAMLGKLDQADPFRDLFLFIWHTGCRPQEGRHVEVRHVDVERAVIVFPKEEAKGKRYPRVIHLHGPSLEIVERLMKRRKQGKLFRNIRGEAWSKYAVCNRVYRLSRSVGIKKAMYDARHGFADRKLLQGHDFLTVAQLMGHRDGSMVAKVYSHLDRHAAHLKKALED
jgi:integrase/recombinase XerC